MKKLSLLALSLMAAPMMAQAAETMEKYGEYYTGPKNEIVTVAYTEGKKNAYIGVSGVNNTIDGKIFRADVTAADGREQFNTKVNDKNFAVLVKNTSAYGGDRATLHLPVAGKMPEEIQLSYDKSMSTEVTPNRLRDEFEAQATKDAPAKK